MKYTDLTYFEIDLADIWVYESDCYDQTGENFKYYRDLYFYLQPHFLSVKHPPFLSHDTIEQGKHSQDYYDTTSRMLTKPDSLFSVFIWQDRFYDMKVPCVIKRDDITLLDFQRLFALKLSQYKQGLLYIKDFLVHHLLNSFEGDQTAYFEFLRLLLIQEDSPLDKTVSDVVAEIIQSWMLSQNIRERETIPEEKILKNKDHLIVAQNDSQENADTSNKLADSYGTEEVHSPNFDVEIPEGYHVIEGRLTREEIFNFFSFLYKEQSEDNKPFLSKQAVIDIFKYGIAIPPPGINITSYKLNISKSYPKNFVEYAIHKFFRKHAEGIKLKADVLVFFCHYFKDFAIGLESGQRFKLFISNITGDKPKRFTIPLDKYLPQEFQ